MSIVVNVLNQKMHISSNADWLVAGSQQFVKFKFNLSSGWDGLKVFAQFRQGDNSYNQYLDDENCVFLPPEIKAGTCTLMLYGSNETIIGTTNYLTLKIGENHLVSNAQSTNISTSLYAQLISQMTEIVRAEGCGVHVENGGEIFNDYERNTAPAKGASARNGDTHANGEYSDVSGYGSTTSKEATAGRAGGWRCHVNAPAGQAEGYACIVDASYGHAQNHQTHVKAKGASTSGRGTIAAGEYQNVRGMYNVEDTEGEFAEIVGGGKGASDRKNIHTLDWDGNAWNAGATLLSEQIDTFDGRDADEVLEQIFSSMPDNSHKTILLYNASTSSHGLPSGEYFVTLYKHYDNYGSMVARAAYSPEAHKVYERQGFDAWDDIDWVNVGADAFLPASFAIKDTATGAYYRMVDGEREWINPPLSPACGECRTAERYGNYPLYAKTIDFGALPDGTKNFGQKGIGIGVPKQNIIRMEGWTTDTRGGNQYKYPMPLIRGGEVKAFYLVNKNSSIIVQTYEDYSAWDARFTIWYIKP